MDACAFLNEKKAKGVIALINIGLVTYVALSLQCSFGMR